MRRVLVVCSVHRERGNATAAELHWLLERLRPEVLFLEHSQDSHTAFMDRSYGSSLESAAVRHYHRQHAVELVPVDAPLDAAALKPKLDGLFERVREASPRCRFLELANLEHTEKGGHGYLNSPVCAELQSEIHRQTRATVDAIGESALSEQYALWTRINDQRELAMLTGVEAFARRNSFEKGVLLVGAAHRDSLMSKSKSLRRDQPPPVVWDFDWELPDETPSRGR